MTKHVKVRWYSGLEGAERVLRVGVFVMAEIAIGWGAFLIAYGWGTR